MTDGASTKAVSLHSLRSFTQESPAHEINTGLRELMLFYTGALVTAAYGEDIIEPHQIFQMEKFASYF